MLRKTQGLVVRVTKYGDTSLITHIYTRELGMQQYMLKGVRSSRSKKNGNLFQPMQFLELDVTNRANKNLQNIREFRPAVIYQNIPFNMQRMAIGMFLLETIQMAVKEQEENALLFDFIYSYFTALDELEEISPLFHHHFLVHFSGLLGFMPDNNYSSLENAFDIEGGHFVAEQEALHQILPVGISGKLYAIIETSLAALVAVQMPKKERNILLQGLMLYYKLHVLDFKEFKTPAIYKTVFGVTIE